MWLRAFTYSHGGVPLLRTRPKKIPYKKRITIFNARQRLLDAWFDKADHLSWLLATLCSPATSETYETDHLRFYS